MTEVSEQFADVQDLKDRWPDMPPGSESYAATLLDDASQFIVDTVPTAMEAPANTRKRIVCAVVRRSMQGPGEALGMEQVQQSAGPFQFSHRPVNPHGDFYLTRLEKKALGDGKQRAFEVDLLAGSRRLHDEAGDPDADWLP